MSEHDPEPHDNLHDGRGQRLVPLTVVLWIAAIATLVAAGAVAFIYTSQNDDDARAGETTSTSTASSTTSTSPPETSTSTMAPTTATPSGPEGTWELATYDGEATIAGSVRPALPPDRVSYTVESDSTGFEETLRLTIDGTPEQMLGDWICLTDDCDTDLSYFLQDSEFVWLIDGPRTGDDLNLSASLHFTLVADDEYLATCYSTAHGGPVVATIRASDRAVFDQDFDSMQVTRAWAYVGYPGTHTSLDGTWYGLDSGAVGVESLLLPPFRGNTMPDCALRDGSQTGGSGTSVLRPSLDLFCPDFIEYEHGTGVTVTFGYDISFASAENAEFSIDYGDGNTYFSPDLAHAERNLFWHDYDQPGIYNVRVTMSTDNDYNVMATCRFEFAWTQPPPSIGSRPPPSSPGYGFDATSCTYNGKPLYGKVEIVDFAADIDVRVVDYFPDLNVEAVDYFPNSCGKWEFVDYFPDFTVRFVDYFGDLTIKFVDYFPGP